MVPRAPSRWELQQPRHRDDSSRSPAARFNKRSSSSSRSNEADDECSGLSDSLDIMGPREPRSERAAVHYEGEDTRPTSKKELAGFYAYGWAAEVFVICGMGSFIPITLEQLARERGVLLSDSLAQRASTSEAAQCIVSIGLGIEINTASFAMYTFSISVLIQTLVIISMSGAADHGRFRKTLLLMFSAVGSIATMLFLPVTPKVFLLGAVLASIANCCIGASFVLLNSFLPVLVRHHPDIQALSFDFGGESDESDELQPHREFHDEPPQAQSDFEARSSRYRAEPSAELQLSTKISSYGIGIGYIAAIIVQIIAIYVIYLTDSSLWSLRLVLFIIGSWWLVFTFPAALWLRPRPGPPLDMARTTGRVRSAVAYLKFSWKALWTTVLRARQLKDVVLFLAAWFLVSDAIATVSGTAVLYAKTTLNMSADAVGLILVIATLSGIVGAFAWSRISAMMGLSPTQTILACILLFELVPLYGLLGYLPIVQRWGFLGLQQSWEVYPLGAVHGFVMGGLSSYCRALFGEIVPPGYEAAFFALYAVTDKGSSVVGPAVVGAIVDATGEIRPAFWFLAVLIALPFPLLYLVDVDRGCRDGLKLAQELCIVGDHVKVHATAYDDGDAIPSGSGGATGQTPLLADADDDDFRRQSGDDDGEDTRS